MILSALFITFLSVARDGSSGGRGPLPSFEMTYVVRDSVTNSGTTYYFVYRSEWSWKQTVVDASDPALIGSTQTYDGKEVVFHQPNVVPDVRFPADDGVPVAPDRWIAAFGVDDKFRDVSDAQSGPGRRVFRFERRECGEAEEGFVLAGDGRCAGAPSYIDEVTVDEESGIPLRYMEIDAGVLRTDMKALEWKLVE